MQITLLYKSTMLKLATNFTHFTMRPRVTNEYGTTRRARSRYELYVVLQFVQQTKPPDRDWWDELIGSSYCVIRNSCVHQPIPDLICWNNDRSPIVKWPLGSAKSMFWRLFYPFFFQISTIRVNRTYGRYREIIYQPTKCKWPEGRPFLRRLCNTLRVCFCVRPCLLTDGIQN